MILRILKRLLSDSATIRDRVSNRIFSEHAPAKTQGECIVLRLSGGTVNNHLTNESDCAQPMVQVDFYAASDSAARSGYQAVRNLLSGYSGTVTYLDDDGTESTATISACNLIRPGALVDEPRDGSDAWSYRHSADFEIFHSQDVPTHV